MTTETNGVDKNLEPPLSPLPLCLKWGKHKHGRIISHNNYGFPASEFQSAPLVKARSRNGIAARKKMAGIRAMGEEEEEENRKKIVASESEMAMVKLASESQFKPLVVEEAPPTAALPWNLRPKKGTAVMKMQEENKATEEEKGIEPKERKKSRTFKSKRLQSKNVILGLSVTLSNSEIEEDFLTMLGKKPPSRPKKRTAAVQQGVEPLYLGMHLKEIPSDRYNVPESSG